jgi:hypothetical protein
MVKKSTQIRGLGVFTSRLPLFGQVVHTTTMVLPQGVQIKLMLHKCLFSTRIQVASQLTEYQILLNFQDQVLVT